MKKLLVKNEFFVALTIIALSIVIGTKNSAFFSVGNLFDLLRSGIVMGMFAVGTLIVIISGGIDVSFPAIASFAMFVTTTLLNKIHFGGSIIVAFAIAGALGILLGLINAVLIAFFKLPTLIVTLGTSSMYFGFLLTFVGVKEIGNLPKSMDDFSKLDLITLSAAGGAKQSLSFSILILIALAIAVAFILKYTMLGRGIYALGGDSTSAERAGFNIKGIQIFIYSFVGFIAGISGIVYTCLMRNCNPINLAGSEMIVIAAVVLGGARITGGHGTMIGTLLGLLLVVIMNNSLILLGVPSYWQRLVIGLLILIGTGITSYQAKRESRKVILDPVK